MKYAKIYAAFNEVKCYGIKVEGTNSSISGARLLHTVILYNCTQKNRAGVKFKYDKASVCIY